MTPSDDPRIVVDAATAAAAEALAVGAVRFHPPPRFEERLAARLRNAAAGSQVTGTSRVADAPVPLPALVPAAAPATGPATGPAAWPVFRAVGIGQAVERVPRPVIVGGAIASGVSLAGAAVVAWVRLRRSS